MKWYTMYNDTADKWAVVLYSSHFKTICYQTL